MGSRASSSRVAPPAPAPRRRRPTGRATPRAQRATWYGVATLILAWSGAGCDDCSARKRVKPVAPDASASATGGTTPVPTARLEPTESAPEVAPEPRCPPDMVRVAKRYCVDRYEAVLVDSRSGERLSPYYSPSKKLALYTVKLWQQKRLTVGDAKARAMPLPDLPLWQRERDPEPKAISRKNMTPNGHVSGEQAAAACRNAGKRLCTIDEWRIACMGEREEQFPYGPDYVQGKCNVFRFAHPAMTLHDDPSKGHSDPRLNQVRHQGKPLLRKTGATPACKSEWYGDAIYDMVGNLDEWIDDADGMFAGGFYSRSTKEGCKWASTAHPVHYADYSTGVRCCADLPGVAPLPRPRPRDAGSAAP